MFTVNYTCRPHLRTHCPTGAKDHVIERPLKDKYPPVREGLPQLTYAVPPPQFAPRISLAPSRSSLNRTVI